MKQYPRTNGKALTAAVRNGHTSVTADGAGGDDATVLTALMMSLVRDLLVVDDATSNLPLRQLRVCVILKDGPRSMSSLSRELGTSLSATTQIADRLELAGLAMRLPLGADRRVRSVQLTPHGKTIMRQRERVKIRRARAALRKLSPRARKDVLTALESLRKACQASKA